ncbi:MAG: NAD(P)(+) transhydrogenase (Re/Si-specific) subunit alpha, partial [Phycisphaerae bacterium]|nr:NAD(P)(+) transhydrogenase (Re/Si-specific) subunit alpha [Phycisphaerae bacterium]
AESGGNCEATKAGETVNVGGVKVIGPENVPSSVPYHASQMYAKNIANLLLLMVKEEEFNIDLEDEILKESLVTDGGNVVNDRVK